MAKQTSSYPWDKIKAKYESGKYQMNELAEEYGFATQSGYNRASKKGWEKGKHEDEIRRRATEKIKKEEADKEAKLRKEYDRILDNIRRATANELFQTDNSGNIHTNFDRLKELKIGSQIIHNCRVEQWEVSEILEVADKAEAESETDKLEALVGAIENAPVKNA